MWHQARHPEVNIYLSTIADILNESPNQALRYKFRHLSHSNEKTIIQEGYLEKYPISEVTLGQLSSENWP